MPSESSRYPQKFLKVRHTDSNMHNEQKLNWSYIFDSRACKKNW
jgi:hypothetical protein